MICLLRFVTVGDSGCVLGLICEPESCSSRGLCCLDSAYELRFVMMDIK